MPIVNSYYQQELARLRELAVEFSKAHPALAPMLGGPSQDPDVERLLEGSAFLTGLLRQKLEDEFPEVVHGLMSLIFPHYLRPIPSTTIVVFKPKPSLSGPLTVPAGVNLASVPVDGTKCLFRTCYDVKVHHLHIVSADIQQPAGRPPTLTLGFEISRLSLTDWPFDRLRVHLTGPYPQAAAIYHLLFAHLSRITVTPTEGGSPLVLPPNQVQPVGLSNDEALIPYPSQSFPGFRILQEYFILPQKLLFFEIRGLDAWRDRGSGTRFNITFELINPPNDLPSVKPDQFILFATPAINLFPHDADPIALDHRQPEYRVIPSGGKPDHYQVYSVERVTGFASGTVQRREYVPFELFRPHSQAAPIYYVNRRCSPIRAQSEVNLSVAYPPDIGPPGPETLSVTLLCTNAALPENLKYGDISQPTSTSPELCEFFNIRPPTSSVQPPLGTNLLWRFLSHLSLNLLSLADQASLQALLRLYIFTDVRDKAVVLANEKRVDGILSVSVRHVDRLVSGLTLRGQNIHIQLNPDHFASRGDMYLFGAVLDHFLGSYAGINTFTHLSVEDALRGDVYEWPVRSGDRPLI